MPNKATGEDLPCRHRNKSGMIILIFNKGRTEAKWSMRTFFSPSLPDRQTKNREELVDINKLAYVCVYMEEAKSYTQRSNMVFEQNRFEPFY